MYRQKKRLLAMLVVLTMLLSMAPMTAVANENIEVQATSRGISFCKVAPFEEVGENGSNHKYVGLKGAKFVLTGDDAQVYGPEESDEDGFVSFYGLAPGTYTLQETEAPEGYVINNQKHEIIMNDDGTWSATSDDSPFQEITTIVDLDDVNEENPVIGFVNEPLRIPILKLNENGEPFEGIKMILWMPNDEQLPLITDADGKLAFTYQEVYNTTEHQLSGDTKYWITEGWTAEEPGTEPVRGYQHVIFSVTLGADGTVHFDDVYPKGAVTKDDDGNLVVTNQKPNLALKKVDDKGTGLQGAVFKLERAIIDPNTASFSGWEDYTTLTTGADGTVSLPTGDGLFEGMLLRITETASPEGYQGTEESFVVDITAGYWIIFIEDDSGEEGDVLQNSYLLEPTGFPVLVHPDFNGMVRVEDDQIVVENIKFTTTLQNIELQKVDEEGIGFPRCHLYPTAGWGGNSH